MSKFMEYVVGFVVAALLLITVSQATPAVAQEKSLYDRLGGQAAIQAVVDEMLKNVAADNRINKFFASADLTRLNKLLVEQICQASGGPCTYSGRSMQEAHAGLGITEADFNALVEDLVKALDKFNVPDKEKNELLGILGSLKPDIVGVPAMSAMSGKSLYDRLGGQAAIQAVVDEMLKNVAADNRINQFFASADLTRLNKLLVEQICQASGGPCTYSGRSMKETHMGLGITAADFNALVEDLVKALDKFNVPDKEKNELLGILGPMQTDIVENPAALPQTGGDIPQSLSNVWLFLLIGLGAIVGGWFLWQRRFEL